MSQPEIDWGDGAPSSRSWESDEARRVRQAKHAREMEWQASQRRAARLRILIAAPLALLALAGATAVGLDYAGVLALGIFPRATEPTPAAPVVASPPPGTERSPAASAPSVPENRAAVAVPVSYAPATPTLSPEQLAKLRDRLGHAERGAAVIARERAEKLAAVMTEDQLLRGSYNPDPSHRRQDSLYDQNKANAVRALELQAAARRGDSGADLAYSNQVILIQNVQARIQNTITNETHDREVLKSLDDRLAKANAEADAMRAQLPP